MPKEKHLQSESRYSREASEKKTDADFECLQQEKTEETKTPMKAKLRSCQNCRRISSPWSTILVVVLVLVLLISVSINIGHMVSGMGSQHPCHAVNASVPCAPACPSGWIGYEGKCYFFSDGGRNWTSSQNFCASYGSSLAVIENEPEKVFLLRYKCRTDYWIGLWMNSDKTWKWADGSKLHGILKVKGEGGDCAFLDSDSALASRCYIQRNWICSHHDAYARNKSSRIRM